LAAAVLSILCLTSAGYAQSVKSPEAKGASLQDGSQGKDLCE
jgi:hypothetical protein